ncbi:MAG TPA: hypothetical protein VF463_09125 [Sphingobium sp.]
MCPPETPEVDAPAGFVPQFAIAFGADGAAARAVDQGSPLPVAASFGVARSTPLAGSSGIAGSFGPFLPDLGRPIHLVLSGTWVGVVTVQRSTDGGVTRLPLTAGGGAWGQYSANANEAVAEESVATATYYLDVQISSGTVAYRLEQ